MIDNIVGIASLPVGVILFLNLFGITHMQSVFGISILLLAALAVIAIQVSNIIGSHIQGEWVALSYILHLFLTFPTILYFLSMVTTLPAAVTGALPAIFASFILVEGLYSFFF